MHTTRAHWSNYRAFETGTSCSAVGCLGTNPSNSMLVIADPTLDLPFAALEGKAVAACGDPERTELLLGKSALPGAL